MPLSAGDKIGPYEILVPVGAGGMGEVYRARDTTLKRDVALKVLPEAFANDPGRMARFRREAEILASLNHANIAAIYGLEDRALVMEMVEGDSPKGPMLFEDAWRIAAQIAAALEYAHEKGVVHRDLKPANIKVTPGGVVKLLDFGLAKAFNEPVAAPAADGMNSPTLTMGATAVGVILGTASYMSPEQAKGKQVDKRADIWAFGVVLYELLVGRGPFQGADVSEILASVIKEEPRWDAADPQTQRLLRKCLAKDPKDRLRDIGDAPALLDETPQPKPVSGARNPRLPWVVAALTTITALALSYVSYHRAPEEAPSAVRVSILPPDKISLAPNSVPAISPDGHRIAFVANAEGATRGLWIRDLDSQASRLLPGTEGVSYPFWSPDNKFIGFFADGKLKRIDAEGAPPTTLADAASPLGGSWSKNDVIVFRAGTNGLLRIPAKGGNATAVTHVDTGLKETEHDLPWFLPDGRHFLYTAVTADLGKSAVYVADVDSQDTSQSRRNVLTALSNVVYSSGYLLFVLDRTLMAQRFDATKLQTIGDPVAVTQQLDYRAGGPDAAFSGSQNGTLVYMSGDPATEVQLTWFDRSGHPAGTLGTPASQAWPAISPDDTKVAIDRRDHPRTGFFELWLYDLKQGNSSRFTFNSGAFHNLYPIWSPDGSHIAFSSSRTGGRDVYQKAVNGTEPDEVLDHDSRERRPTDWSRDGQYIIEDVLDPKTKGDIWVLPRFGDRKSFPYIHSEVTEQHAKLSPNGLWLAYESTETNNVEIYVQAFPKPGGKRKISTNGGSRPVWSRDGKALFFFDRTNRTIMAVAVNSGANFEAGTPHALFDARQAGTGSWFDVDKDGRFLIPVQPEGPGTRSITVVLDWQAGLTR